MPSPRTIFYRTSDITVNDATTTAIIWQKAEDAIRQDISNTGASSWPDVAGLYLVYYRLMIEALGSPPGSLKMRLKWKPQEHGPQAITKFFQLEDTSDFQAFEIGPIMQDIATNETDSGNPFILEVTPSGGSGVKVKGGTAGEIGKWRTQCYFFKLEDV